MVTKLIKFKDQRWEGGRANPLGTTGHQDGPPSKCGRVEGTLQNYGRVDGPPSESGRVGEVEHRPQDE